MFEVSHNGRAVVLHVPAEIDFSSADALEQTMRTAASSEDAHVVVDLSACTYLDSSCLAVLVRQHRRLGARLAVVLPRHARTRRIFEVSGLIIALPIYESVAAATDDRTDLERIAR